MYITYEIEYVLTNSDSDKNKFALNWSSAPLCSGIGRWSTPGLWRVGAGWRWRRPRGDRDRRRRPARERGAAGVGADSTVTVTDRWLCVVPICRNWWPFWTPSLHILSISKTKTLTVTHYDPNDFHFYFSLIHLWLSAVQWLTPRPGGGGGIFSPL